MGRRCGRGHSHRAVEAWVVVEGFGDGFRPVFHHLLVRFFLHRGHLTRLDLFVGFLAHRFDLIALFGGEDGVEIEFQGGFEVVAVITHLGCGGFHLGCRFRAVFHHGEFAGGDLDLAADLFVVRPGGPFEVLEVACHHDAVIQHLTEHAAGGGCGEISLALFADRQRNLGGELGAAVGVGECDHADQVAYVEAAGDELMGKKIQGRGVVEIDVGREIVERLDEAVADELRPHAVDERLGEEVIAGIGDKSGELVAQFAGAVDIAMDVEQSAVLFCLGENLVLLAADQRAGCIEKGVERRLISGSGFLLLKRGARLFKAADVSGCFLFDLGLEGVTWANGLALFFLGLVLRRPHHRHLVALCGVDHTAPPIADFLGFSEKCGEVVKVALLPVVEWMVVAHCATHADAEEDLCGGGGEFHRVRVVSEDEADGGVRVRAARCADEFTGEDVVGFSCREGAVDVGEELVSTLDIGADPQHIRHEDRPAVGEAFVGQQAVDELFPATFARGIELADFLHRRDAADDVDGGAAEEGCIADGWCGDGLRTGVFTGQDVVDNGCGIGSGNGDAIRDWDALDRLGFLRGESHAFRPRRTGFHPGIEQGDLGRLQGAAFVGHHALVDRTQVDTDENFAGSRVTEDDGIGGVAAFHDQFVGVHPEAALGLVGVVAAHAVPFQDGLDVLDEIRRCDRRMGGQGHKGCRTGKGS